MTPTPIKARKLNLGDANRVLSAHQWKKPGVYQDYAIDRDAGIVCVRLAPDKIRVVWFSGDILNPLSADIKDAEEWSLDDTPDRKLLEEGERLALESVARNELEALLYE